MAEHGGHGGGEGHGKSVSVGVDYHVEDHASHALHGIAEHGHHAGHALHELREKVAEVRKENNLTIPALLGMGVGLGALIEKAKEANAEFMRTQRAVAASLSTVLAWDKSIPVVERYQRSLALARETTEELEHVQARFGGQLDDIGQAYKTIAISAAPLKLTQEQLLRLTTQAAAAAKVYGVSATDAANRISTALMRRGAIRAGGDDFNRALFQMLQGLKGHSGVQVLHGMQKGFRDLEAQADAASHTMDDSLRRVRITVDELVRDLSGPLFQEVARMFGDVARGLREAGTSGRPKIVEYAEELRKAFVTFEHVSRLILDHWKALAAIWAGAKIAGMAGNLAKAAGAMAGGGGGGGAGRAAGLIPLVGGAVAGVAEAYQEREGQRAELAEKAKALEPFFKAAREAEAAVNRGDVAGARRAMTEPEKLLHERGIGSEDDLRRFLAEGIAGARLTTHDKTPHLIASMEKLAATFEALHGIKSLLPDLPEEESQAERDKKLRTHGKGDINIQHLEIRQNFEDVDPERVFVRFTDDMHQLASRRTQSSITPHDLG